jgi:DNA-binding transcriptional regulator PaaX
MDWLLFTSQLPTSPSSLRVMVWRRMKAAGAVGLQNGVWVLPHSKEQVRFLQELLDYLKEQGASGQSFAATALNQSIENDLLERFQAQRDEEYAELIERCQDLLSELDKETQKQKFTFAELEENEDDLQKLRNWLARINARDYVGGKRADEASQQVEACAVALEEFANQVYIQEKLTSQDDPFN